MPLSLPKGVCAALLLSLASPALADQQAVSLTLDAPAAGVNRLNIGITDPGGTPVADSQSSDFSGTIETLIELSFDPGTQQASLSGLEFTGGQFSGTEINFLLGGLIPLDIVGLGGTVDTPAPFGTVTGTTFNINEHELVVNQGSINIIGQSLLLADNPVAGSSDGLGMIEVNLTGIVGGVASYEVLLDLPVSFSDTYSLTDPDTNETQDFVVTIDGGSLVGTGTFTRPVPEPVLAGPLLLMGALFRRRRRTA